MFCRITLPMPMATTIFTEGERHKAEPEEELILNEPGSMLSRVPADLEKDILATLRESNTHSAAVLESQKQVVESLKGDTPPNGPLHPKYRDGREVWTGRNGSKWRYNQKSLKWICTEEGK